MLNLLDRIIRRTNIDDPKVIDRVHFDIRLVRRPQTTFILVKQEMSAIGGIGGGELGDDVEHLWIGSADRFTDV